MGASTETKGDVTELGGSVLAVLRQLLEMGATDEVVALVEKLVTRNSELERMLQLKGRKREGVSKEQLLLALDGLLKPKAAEDGDESDDDVAASEVLQNANTELRSASQIDSCGGAPAGKPAPQPSLRGPIPAHLRRVDNPIQVPDEQRECPSCGKQRTTIGEETCEVVELIPAEIVVRVDRREKLKCESCDGHLARAPAGDKVVSGGRFGCNFVATLLTDKYDDGLPLHRQKLRLKRMGMSIPVSTLSDQVRWATDLLKPLWLEAQRVVLLAYVMHLDATGLPVLDRDKQNKRIGTGKRLGNLWGYVGDDTAVFLYCSTGHKQGQSKHDVGPEDFLNRRTGYTVADASGLFDASFKRPELIECGCNMHARRYFVKAFDGGDELAALPLAAFKKLYKIEHEHPSQEEAAIRIRRQTLSRPVYEKLTKWCETYEGHVPPKKPLGRAIRYLTKNEKALTRFLEDGRIPLDNGAVERLHIRAALSRKNFLFVGSDAGGHRAAIAYSMLACCRLAEVNPNEYFADVLPRLSRGVRGTELAELLPAAWKANRAQ